MSTPSNIPPHCTMYSTLCPGASWKAIGSLPTAIHSFGTVAMDGIIYIVGGEGQNGELLDTVYIFDTITDMVTVHDERLTFTVRNPAVIMVNGTLYVFGDGQMAKMDMLSDYLFV